MKDNYLVIDKRVLADVYEKVVNAKNLLKDGKVKDVTEAAKTAGISRSVYYKYKDFVFEFAETSQGKKVTFSMSIKDKKGVLSEILNYISEEGGNILTINQSIPINEAASLTLTVDISSLDGDIKTLLEDLAKIPNVEKVDFIAME
ncbi:ACT domain-containing protein [Clostridium gasigenes]|uniref:ACT domain-containing protein n=1 Tax=Clostridium gasigenes TaxID=94869 RepID=UPI001C0D2C15|nr:ACT domain-containing protein [Clostridium gasigenes]MBU3089287.1 ACT domain-containing protein [Clostridium gasigenes]